MCSNIRIKKDMLSVCINNAFIMTTKESVVTQMTRHNKRNVTFMTFAWVAHTLERALIVFCNDGALHQQELRINNKYIIHIFRNITNREICDIHITYQLLFFSVTNVNSFSGWEDKRIQTVYPCGHPHFYALYYYTHS